MPYEGRDTKRMFPVVKVRTMAIVITATSAVRCLPSGLHTRSLGAGHADLRRAPQPAPLLGWTSRDAKGHLPLHCFFSMGFYNLDEIRMDSQGSELKARLVSVPIREPDGGHHPTTVGLSDAPPPPPPQRCRCLSWVPDRWLLRDRGRSLTSWGPSSSPFKRRVTRAMK